MKSPGKADCGSGSGGDFAQLFGDLLIGEIIRDTVNAAPHVFTTGYDSLDRIPLAAKAVRYSCVVQAESFQPDDGFVV